MIERESPAEWGVFLTTFFAFQVALAAPVPSAAVRYFGALSAHLEELFMFVEYPDVPSENNGAERALRPCVIMRKVCGGTRSEKGSQTKMTLLSLFGTWHVRGLDMLDSCRQLLTGGSALFAVSSNS